MSTALILALASAAWLALMGWVTVHAPKWWAGTATPLESGVQLDQHESGADEGAVSSLVLIDDLHDSAGALGPDSVDANDHHDIATEASLAALPKAALPMDVEPRLAGDANTTGLDPATEPADTTSPIDTPETQANGEASALVGPPAGGDLPVDGEHAPALTDADALLDGGNAVSGSSTPPTGDAVVERAESTADSVNEAAADADTANVDTGNTVNEPRADRQDDGESPAAEAGVQASGDVAAAVAADTSTPSPVVGSEEAQAAEPIEAVVAGDTASAASSGPPGANAVEETAPADDSTPAASEQAEAEQARAAWRERQRQRRVEELATLMGLSHRIRVNPDSMEFSARTQEALDGIFDPLFLHNDVDIWVHVDNHEFEEPYRDVIVGNRRATVVADYLISRGLDPQRFHLSAEQNRALPYGTHRVSVQTRE